MMKRFVALALLLPLSQAILAEEAFRHAKEIAIKIVSHELSGGLCAPATPTPAQREEVRAALDGITEAGFTDAMGLGPLNLAVLSDDVVTLKRLGALGYPLKPSASELLLDASLHEARATLAYLLSVGADPNWQNRYGATALMEAAANGRIAIARALINAGASAQLQNRDGGTALYYALMCRNQPMVDLLISAGAVIDDKARALASEKGISLERDER